MARNSIPEPLRGNLLKIHGGMLDLHKILIEHERARYESQRGPIRSPGEFLQLLIGDPFFSWLRPMSGLVAVIDEFLETKDPVNLAEGEALVSQARVLVAPLQEGNEFQRGYFRALNESTDIGAAHGTWKRLLAELP
jgi:hypothetical protein